MTLLQKPIVYSSLSRLTHPRAFLRNALKDLREGVPTARRFFKRGLTQHYRHSSLGIVWAFAPPIITALVLTAGQRTNLISHQTSTIPAAFFGVFGIMFAQAFLESLNILRSLFSTHQQILRRNNVAIEGLIMAAILEVGFSVTTRLCVLLASFFLFSVKPSPLSFLLLPSLIGLIFTGCGIGLLLAPLNALKRDIQNVMMLLPWILFATTPIFVEVKPGSFLSSIYKYNPLAWVFDSMRTLAYGAPGSIWPALFSVPIGICIFLFGWLTCRLWRPYVVERSLV